MRSCRFGLLMIALLPGAASAGTLPEGLTRQGGVIMMQPIPDRAPAAGTDIGDRPAEERATLYRVLGAGDHDLYTRAFAAADRGDWVAARGLAAQGHDAIAAKLIQWRYLIDKNSGAPFAEIDAFLRANPDWPGQEALMARAEAALDPSTPPTAVIAWFGGRDPVTALGKIRLGEAMIASGRGTEGRVLLRQGWMEGSFTPDQELAVAEKDGAYITPEADRERLSNLLWQDDVTAARRQMARVGDAEQRIAQARIALIRGLSPAQAAALPAGAAAGLAFDRARALRRNGDNDGAAAILLGMPLKETMQRHPDVLWPELNIVARQALQDGKPQTAYALVSDTGLTSGNAFADAEFLAGWIALRFLHDPAAALSHFRKLAAGVSRPISFARAHYWLGRAAEAAGDPAAAWADYRAAARMSGTFYGQLAEARTEAQPILRLVADTPDPPPSRAAFDDDELVRAMRVLADVGQQTYLRIFAVHYAKLHEDAGHVRMLARSLVAMGYRNVAVRVAKEAAYDGIDLPAYAYPVIPLPAYRGPGAAPSDALVLGLIRQETEFDADAVSGAGARGIMQIMPATARRIAARADLPYRPNALTGDPDYNIRLGMAEFAGYLADWNGSVVLAAAAYNAGPTNVRRWLATNGDPRSPGVDPIDWIEEIPFGETRNYVQRVLENMQVYRNRLSGREEPLAIMADLYAPGAPPDKVLTYTPPPAPAPASRREKSASRTD